METDKCEVEAVEALVEGKKCETEETDKCEVEAVEVLIEEKKCETEGSKYEIDESQLKTGLNEKPGFSEEEKMETDKCEVEAVEALIEEKKCATEDPKCEIDKNKLKTGLNEKSGFSEEEKKIIIEEFNKNRDSESRSVQMKGALKKYYAELSKKYKTTEMVIRRLVIPPNDPLNHPDYPRKSQGVSKQELDKKIEEYYRIYGLKQLKDFREDEKKAMNEEGSVKLIGPKVLSKKYNTTIFVVRSIATEAGLPSAPDDLSKFPDFPKKSENMSNEEFQKTVKKYWIDKTESMKKAKTESQKCEIEIDKSKMITEPLNRKRLGPDRNYFGPNPNYFGPKPNYFGQDPNYFEPRSNLPNFRGEPRPPKNARLYEKPFDSFHSGTRYESEIRAIRQPKDINDDEKKEIVYESIIRRINQHELSIKYKTSVEGIRQILHDAGFHQIPSNWATSNFPFQGKMSQEEYYKLIQVKLKIANETPKNLTNFPDFPEKSKGMSDQEYYDIIMKYWEQRISNNRKEDHNEKTTQKLCTDMFDDFSFPKNFNEEEEKKIVEDCMINRINLRDLTSTYDTTMEHIRDILRRAGFCQVPKNWNEAKLPEKSDDISPEEYYKTLQWLIKIKMKMPHDMSEYPDFPEKLESMSYEEHYKAIVNFWEIHDAIVFDD